MMLIKTVGIFIVAMGVVILLNPKFAKRMMAFWRRGNNVYLAGFIRLVLGALFVFYAARCSSPKVIYTLGLLMLFGGMLILLLGPERSNAMIDWVAKKPEYMLRLLGLLAMSIGGLVLYSA